MELVVFLVAAAVCLGGALGVVLNSNPVHAALSLVATLFGVAVLFVAQDAHFLAAVQVIVYAGAIVVLFLFVLMLLGVDRAEDLSIEPIAGQRIAAAVVGLGVLALPVLAIVSTEGEATGVRPLDGGHPSVAGTMPFQVATRGPEGPLFVGPYAERLEKVLSRYPDRQAALLPALHIAHEIRGHISPQTMDEVADRLELPPRYTAGDLQRAMQGHVLAEAVTWGRYTLNPRLSR